MPVSTQLIRNNQPLPIRWGHWHLECLRAAAAAELHDMTLVELDTMPDVDWCDAMRSVDFFPDTRTYTRDHLFVDDADQEVFIILPGDTFTCYR